jgi:L-threonylcarbamoyladenylate synthase
VIRSAVAAILRGEVVGLPTDTVYGIGADPTNPDAVERLFELKGRPGDKPVGLLASSLERAAEVAELDGPATELATTYWPGPLTLVLRPRVIMADWVGDTQLRTVGVRVPDHPLALELLSETGPLAVTSANRSGGRETMSDDEARAVFGDSVAVYLVGRAPGGRASTVVDCTGGDLVVLREGPVEI